MTLCARLAVLPILFVSVLSLNEIEQLPGLNHPINFKHYSGYVKASPTRFLHYWFVESQNDPANDPLVFWYNGGPGCTSLEGLLNEMGPYLLNDDQQTLRENPHAWNKFANVVYMEAPAGVGFSYITENGTDGWNDDSTSRENYNGIKDFFRAFPQFRNHSVFIIGESYGGMYMPTLAERMIDGQEEFPINFEGIAIGNGLVKRDLMGPTGDLFLYTHGFYDEREWTTFTQECCNGSVTDCQYDTFDGHCQQLRSQFPDIRDNINAYDIYRNCQVPLLALQAARFPLRRRPTMLKKNPTSKDDCGAPLGTYLNSPEVRKALHIPASVPEWHTCNDHITDVYKQGDDVTEQVKKALAQGVRVLLYYGDVDAVCNFMMGQKFADSLGYKQKEPKTAWSHPGPFVSGFKTEYEGGLTFTTIRGAGHMAPQWKAEETQYAIRQFLANQPL